MAYDVALALPSSVRRYDSPWDRILANSRPSSSTFYNGTPCRLWQGTLNRHGYGTMSMRTADRPWPIKQLVHRFVIHLRHGIALATIDFGMHLCNVKRCACPEHLKNGTQSENEKYKHVTGGYPFDRHGNLIRTDFDPAADGTIIDARPDYDPAIFGF